MDVPNKKTKNTKNPHVSVKSLKNNRGNGKSKIGHRALKPMLFCNDSPNKSIIDFKKIKSLLTFALIISNFTLWSLIFCTISFNILKTF